MEENCLNFLLSDAFLVNNECLLGTHNCHPQAACINTQGGFNCVCNSGFVGDGKNCKGEPIVYCNYQISNRTLKISQ